MRRTLFLSWLPPLLAMVVLAGCTVVTPTPLPPQEMPTAVVSETATPPLAETPLPEPGALLPSIADVVERVKPAVVAISVRVTTVGFFGPVEGTQSGSGIIFDSKGLILTNNHVVEGALSIAVTLADTRTLEAELVGRDPQTDLAVIRIKEGVEYPTAHLGNSEKLRIGDWVIAIGNALALEGGPTVTLGIVGAKDRSIPVEGGLYLHDMVQTDAAINPGNSGGPLVNLDGEVVGINTAIAQGGQGIGFSISTSTAIPIAEQLVSNGRVIWPYIGVSVDNVTPQVAIEEGLSVRQGVFIAGVVRGGPADKARLAPGDVIIKIGDQDIPDVKTLQRVIRSHAIGDEVELTFLRGNREQAARITLEEWPRSQ